MRTCFLSFTHPYYDTRILYKEARSLVEAGFNVVHLAPGSGEDRIEKGVQIYLYPAKPGIWGRVRKYFTLYHRAIQVNADVYHCNELESWLVGCVIKLFHRNKRVIFDVHEHYPSRFEGERYPFWLKWVTQLIVLFLYRVLASWTDYFIFAKRSVAPDFHGVEEKCCFVFNYGMLRMLSHEHAHCAPDMQAEFAQNLVAIHVGFLSIDRGWKQLLQALTMMKDKKLHFVHYGEVIEGESALMAEAEHLGIANRVHLYPRVPFEEMYERLLCADVGLMLYQPGILNHVYAFPMKMYDYMLAGLPVVGPNFAVEVAPIIDEVGCGLLIDTSKPEEIAKAIDWICTHPEEAKSMGERGRQAVIEKYNWETEAKKLIRIYRRFVRL